MARLQLLKIRDLVAIPSQNCSVDMFEIILLYVKSLQQQNEREQSEITTTTQS